MTATPTPLADTIARHHQQALYALGHPWRAVYRFNLGADPVDPAMGGPAITAILVFWSLFLALLGFGLAPTLGLTWLWSGLAFLGLSLGCQVVLFFRRWGKIARGELRVTVLSSCRIHTLTQDAVEGWAENGALRHVHVTVLQYALTSFMNVKRLELNTSIQTRESKETELRTLAHTLFSQCIPGYVPHQPLPPIDKETP
jgi:hypothetical protein